MLARRVARDPARVPGSPGAVPSVRRMDRRRFLLTLAAGLVGAAAAHGAAGLDGPDPAPGRPVPRLAAARPAAATAKAAAPPLPTAVAPPTGVVSRLPGEGSL